MRVLYFFMLLLVGCSSKNVEINGLVCPDNLTEQMVQRDLSECRYYDEKRIAEKSKAPLSIECQECLKKKGYEIKED